MFTANQHSVIAAPLLITWFGSGRESLRSREQICWVQLLLHFSVAGGKFSLVPQVVICVHIGQCQDSHVQSFSVIL